MLRKLCARQFLTWYWIMRNQNIGRVYVIHYACLIICVFIKHTFRVNIVICFFFPSFNCWRGCGQRCSTRHFHALPKNGPDKRKPHTNTHTHTNKSATSLPFYFPLLIGQYRVGFLSRSCFVCWPIMEWTVYSVQFAIWVNC